MYLGIDVGTGGSRALLIDENGKQIGAVTAPHQPITMHQPLWAEQDPRDWGQAVFAAVRQLLAETGARGADVKGIGLSGQMHGLTMLDRAGEVIRPALIWCDQRSQPQVDAINAAAGREAILQWTANPMLTGFTLPKLLWVRDHDRASYDRLATVLLPKDYARFLLTGERATEVSDASGTGLFDVVQRHWSYEMADAVGLSRDVLPRAYESAEVTGTVSREAAEQTGLAAGTPVVGGGGDQACSATGNGIVAPGLVSCTLGTSGVVFAHMDQVTYDPRGRVHTFCHAVPAKWHVMGVTQGAGLSLQWMRNTLAAGAEYDALMAEAATAEPGSRGLFWLPYLMGERTPHLDPHARGGWVGLTAAHTRADLIRAVIEGVSFSQLDCLRIVESLGVTVSVVRASGGGARSPIWLQILADVFNKPVATLETQEGSAFGAALLAATGTGHFASLEEACAAAIRETRCYTPRPEAVTRYAEAYETYTRLYPALRPVLPR